MRSALDAIWASASKGDSPVFLAAFMTNLAFVEFESIVQRLLDTCKCSDPDQLREKFLGGQGPTDGSSVSAVAGTDRALSYLVNYLCVTWSLLLDARDFFREGRKIVVCPMLILRREDFIVDKQCLTTFIHNFSAKIHANKTPCPSKQNIPLGNQMLKLIGGEGEIEGGNAFRCAYGLHLLLSTTKAYRMTDRPPSYYSVRLSSLRFVQDALSDVDTVLADPSFPCTCCGSLAAELTSTRKIMNSFVSTRVFDPMTLCPWTSGSHQLHWHATLFGHGMRLLSYRHYIASIIHVYHTLRLFSNLAPVPLLEHMRIQFAPLFFPGGLPEMNFRPSWIRFMGGRLSFDGAAHKYHLNGNHGIRFPATSARVSAGFCLEGETDARLDVAKVSMMHHIDNQGMRMNDATWRLLMSRANGDDVKVVGSSKGRANDLRPQPSTTRLSKLLPDIHKAILEADFAPDFPRARLNFFAIYMACVRVARQVSRQGQVLTEMKRTQQRDETKTQEQKSKKDKERKIDDADDGNDWDENEICLCFMDTILKAADEEILWATGKNRKERREKRKAKDKAKNKGGKPKEKEATTEDQDVDFEDPDVEYKGEFGSECREVLGITVQAIQQEFEGKGMEAFVWK